jgi:hypothetical protein
MYQFLKKFMQNLFGTIVRSVFFLLSFSLCSLEKLRFFEDNIRYNKYLEIKVTAGHH